MKTKLLLIPLIFILSLISSYAVSVTFASGNIDSAFIIPLDNNTFASIWCDEAIDEVRYSVYDADGTLVLAESPGGFATGGCSNQGDAIDGARLNSTHFVIAKTSTALGTARFQVFTKQGINHTLPIVVDASMGSGNTVSVSAFNSSRFVYAWVDDGSTDERVRTRIYSNTGSALSPQLTVSDADTQDIRDVSVGTFNSTAFVVLHQEQQGGPKALMFDTYQNITVVANEIVIDADMGVYSEYDTATLTENIFVATWIDGADVSYGVYTFSGGTILAQTVIDTVTASTENIQVDKINESAFAIVWTDSSASGSFVTIRNTNGGTVLPNTKFSEGASQPVGVGSFKDGTGFCKVNGSIDKPHTLVLAGETLAGDMVWSANETTLKEWNGLCGPFVDDIPPIITLISPANNTATNIVPLNITFSVSDAQPAIICELTNSTALFDTVTTPISTNANLTLAKGEIVLDQEFPNLLLTCYDNSPANNSATLNLNYTLDTNPPIIIPISPANNSVFNRNLVSSISIQANCTDVPVFAFNITVRNSSDIIAMFEDTTAVNNVLSIDETLDISTLENNYQVIHQCWDTHTDFKIPNWNIGKKKTEDKVSITWVTPEGHEFEISYDPSDYKVSSYGSQKSEDESKYSFFFNINETEGIERTYKFEVENKKRGDIIYMENSKYPAHFILKAEKLWIDFDFGDPEAEYYVSKNKNGNYEVEISTKKTSLNFGSAGALNMAELTTEFQVVDTTVPTEFFTLNECAFDNTTNVIVFGLLLLLGIIIILVGWLIGSSLVSVFGALMFLFMGIFLFGCTQVISALVIFTSLAIMVVLLIQGSSGRFGFHRNDTL